jgi:hypothetical protein
MSNPTDTPNPLGMLPTPEPIEAAPVEAAADNAAPVEVPIEVKPDREAIFRNPVEVTANGVTIFHKFDAPTLSVGVVTYPTVYDQALYASKFFDTRNDPMYLRLWESAKTLIKTWQCDVMPDYKVDLKTVSDPACLQVVIWIGNTLMSHFSALEAPPKN